MNNRNRVENVTFLQKFLMCLVFGILFTISSGIDQPAEPDCCTGTGTESDFMIVTPVSAVLGLGSSANFYLRLNSGREANYDAWNQVWWHHAPSVNGNVVTVQTISTSEFSQHTWELLERYRNVSLLTSKHPLALPLSNLKNYLQAIVDKKVRPSLYDLMTLNCGDSPIGVRATVLEGGATFKGRIVVSLDPSALSLLPPIEEAASTLLPAQGR